jgi:hypothetical protein
MITWNKRYISFMSLFFWWKSTSSILYGTLYKEKLFPYVLIRFVNQHTLWLCVSPLLFSSKSRFVAAINEDQVDLYLRMAMSDTNSQRTQSETLLFLFIFVSWTFGSFCKDHFEYDAKIFLSLGKLSASALQHLHSCFVITKKHYDYLFIYSTVFQFYEIHDVIRHQTKGMQMLGNDDSKDVGKTVLVFRF